MELRIMDLRDLPRDAEATFGGKACGLACLIAAGAAVPAGFAVEATTVSPDEWSETQRETFLRRARELLDYGSLVVRSSAVGEDSAERSFAGLFETVLGVRTPEEALAGAGRCIASGKSERVLEYSGAGKPAAVGVVVQRVVEARAAGVCFTRDPMGTDGALIVETVAGMGDKLVSGAAEPERLRAYRSGLGGWEIRPEGANVVLTDGETKRIASESLRLADAFQCPLDLEWAIDEAGTLWWLQARPITGAQSPPEYVIQRSFEDVDDGPVTVWSNWNVRETLPDPMYPLTWTVWRDIIIPMATGQIFGVSASSPMLPYLYSVDLIHGRIYFNMNGFTAVPLFGPMAARVLSAADSRAGDIVRDLISAGVLRARRLPGSRVGLSAKILTASLLSALRLVSGIMPRRALKILEEDGTAISRRRAVSELSNSELIDEIQLFVLPECRRIWYGLQLETVAMGIHSVARHVFREHPAALALLAAGIPNNPTTEISMFVDELARAAAPLVDIFFEPLGSRELMEKLEATPEGAWWLKRFRSFLGRFGHRGPMEFDMGATRWAEDPTMILDLIREHLKSPSPESMQHRMERLTSERREAIGKATAASPIWRRPIMRAMARLVELYMPLREAPKHYGVIVFQRMRLAALELGERLAAAGVIKNRDDVFFIEWAELIALAEGEQPDQDLLEKIDERKERLARFQAEQAPDFLRSDGVPVVEDAPAERDADGTLHGTAVSAGCASGAVRILKEPNPKSMREGEVIVMQFADPGWTPLFPRAAAVVMEVGGLMCHAAVVAREMGIPAVFGISGATRILTDGQRVSVDGTLGTVTPEQ